MDLVQDLVHNTRKKRALQNFLQSPIHNKDIKDVKQDWFSRIRALLYIFPNAQYYSQPEATHSLQL